MKRYIHFVRDNANWLAAGVLLSFTSCFGQTFVISVLAGEIRADFGLSNTGWAVVYMIGTLGSAGAVLWAGSAVDHFRVRVVGALTLGGLALACLAMAAVSSVWALAAVILALRFFGIGMSSHIASVAMTRWFVSNRGRALAVATMGFAIGEAILPLSMVAALTVVGWRVIWVAAAGLVTLLIPALWWLLRRERTPQSIAREAPVAGMAGVHWPRSAVLRHWLFWMVAPALLAPWACATSFFFHQVHLAQVRGWSHVSLVTLFPIYTLSWIVSMAASGWAADRFGAIRLMPWYQLVYVACFLILGLTTSLWAAAVGLILLGVGAGAHAAIPPVFWAEVYGTRHLGAIRATVAAIMVFGSALGPGITGWFIDHGLNFGDQMVWIAGWFVLTTLPVIIATRWAGRSLPVAL